MLLIKPWQSPGDLGGKLGTCFEYGMVKYYVMQICLAFLKGSAYSYLVYLRTFFSQPSPKLGRELQTVLNTRENDEDDEDP